MLKPVRPAVLAQRFGDNTTGVPDFYTRFGLPAHEGEDYAGEIGDPIYAVHDGVIDLIAIPGQGGIVANHAYGIHIKIGHDGYEHRYVSQYCHMSRVVANLNQGDVVAASQLIGFLGNTGNVVKGPHSDGSHLHFMLRKAGATLRGEQQQLVNGSWVVYPNDLVNPAPYWVR